MMPTRVRPEQLAVQDMGKSRQGNPIVDLRVGKGPANRLEGQTLLHHRVRGHIGGVVVINEPKMRRLAEHRENRQRQKNADTRRLQGLRVPCFWRRLLTGRFHNPTG